MTEGSTERDRRWFLGTAVAAVLAAGMRPRPRRHRRANAFAAPATAGGAVPVAILNTGTFNATLPWPDATTTGHVNAPGYTGSLTNGSAVTITSNTTYNFYSFPDGVNVGAAGSPVTNVTFYGCSITGSGDSGALALLYGDGITFNYCTFGPPGLTAPPVSHAAGYQYGIEADGSFNTSVQALTVQNCNMYGFAEGIDVSGGTQAKPHVYRRNYIHDARADGGVDHTDGLGAQSGGGSESFLVLDNNNIQSAGNTNGIAYQGGTYSNVTCTNNLFGGFGYTINFSGTMSSFTFTGNTYSTAILPSFGPLYPSGGNWWLASAGSSWRQNKWLVPAGAQWGHSQYNGYFWLPGTTSNASPSLDELSAGLVSLTDFTG